MDNLDEKIKAKIDSKNDMALKRHKENMTIRQEVCPNCAGDLQDISSIFTKIFCFSFTKKYKCAECKKEYIYKLLD